MVNPSISVLISTRNRPAALSRCLLSLCRQTVKPLEIVIVDNGPSSETKNICSRYETTLPIRYAIEKRRGLPFGRNKGISLARGKICAFIDDDCIADKQWIGMVQKHFCAYSSVGVIGFTHDTNPTNIPSCIENIYYYRWLLEGVSSLHKTGLLLSGFCIDFRNAAFLSRFIKQFQFNTKLLVSCEDVEMGLRLYRASSNIYFNPTITVSHNNSPSYRKLFIRNFMTGYATQDLISCWGVRQEQIRQPYNPKKWHSYRVHVLSQLNGIHRKLFCLCVLWAYPWSSRLGRFAFILKLPQEWFLPGQQ